MPKYSVGSKFMPNRPNTDYYYIVTSTTDDYYYYANMYSLITNELLSSYRKGLISRIDNTNFKPYHTSKIRHH